jgi:uncharacterized protein
MESKQQQKLAIIGTGISGLGCAYFLHQDYDITLFEAGSYVGGHTNTIEVEENGVKLPVDTGFMVFNHVTYPLLTKLFKQLGVETKKTDMSFSLSHRELNYEYNGKDFNSIFGQRKNLFSLRFWRFILKINRFNKETAEALKDHRYAKMTLAEYVQEKGYGQDFLNWYILPMASAVWSAPTHKMMEFPAVTLMRFWYNHGFLGMKERHPWWTVVNGSREYVKKIVRGFEDRILLNTPVKSVQREKDHVVLKTAAGELYHFDKVIFATHAPTTLKILQNPNQLEVELLSAFDYQSNTAVVHTDESVMPKNKLCWASWNYSIHNNEYGVIQNHTHYWMNSLQGISDKVNYFVTLGNSDAVDSKKIIRQIEYEHPLFDLTALKMQSLLPDLNKSGARQQIFYCGAYFRYGFHEDGFGSAYNLCRTLLNRELW